MATSIKSPRITWGSEDLAAPAMVEPLLDDMGLGAEYTERAAKAREAAKQYCLFLLKDGVGIFTMGDLNLIASSFYDGYLKGLDC